MYSTLRNAIRGGFNVSRLAEYLQKRLSQGASNEREVGHVFLVDTGGQTTISGSGKIFENFKKCGKLSGYTGMGENAVEFFDKGYKTANLRYMNFDETYHGMPYDCTRSKYICNFKYFVVLATPFCIVLCQH